MFEMLDVTEFEAYAIEAYDDLDNILNEEIGE